MDDTRSDDLIRRNHELLAAAAKAWSDFMETVARIDPRESAESESRALWHGWPKASRDRSRRCTIELSGGTRGKYRGAYNGNVAVRLRDNIRSI